MKSDTALRTDQFLVIAHGTTAEVAKAKEIIEATNPVECTVHAAETLAA